MNKYQQEYDRKKMSARQVLEHIQSGDFIFTPMAASCPDALMNELPHLKETGVKDLILQSWSALCPSTPPASCEKRWIGSVMSTAAPCC